MRNVEVRLDHKKMPREDCEECTSKNIILEEIQSRILLEGDLNEIQRNRLLEIAVRCPVHRTLAGNVQIRSELL